MTRTVHYHNADVRRFAESGDAEVRVAIKLEDAGSRVVIHLAGANAGRSVLFVRPQDVALLAKALADAARAMESPATRPTVTR